MRSTINDIMERASQSLAQMDYLSSEIDCLRALAMARQAQDWQMYAAILLPLQECRRQRRMTAADGWVQLGTTSLENLPCVVDRGPGCLVVTHPHNSLAALRLSQQMLRDRQYIEVLYADNDASADTWTFISPAGAMVALDLPAPPASWRDRPLAPDEAWPADKPRPRKGIPPRPGDWFIDATEALGDAALKTVKAPLGTIERIAQLENALTAVTDHEFLHQRLAEAARAMVKPT